MGNSDLNKLKAKIKSQISLLELVQQYIESGIRTIGQGHQCVCPLPEHGEGVGSFTIYPDHHYHCFGCGKTGDVITYVMETQDLTYKEALAHLATMVNESLPEKIFSQTERRNHQLRIDIGHCLDKAAEIYYSMLWDPPPQFSRQADNTLEYLVQERGFDEETLQKLGVGLAPRQSNRWLMFNKLREGGFDEDIVRATGLVGERGDIFNGYAMLPIIKNRKVVGFGGRLLGQEDRFRPKYLNTFGSELFRKREVLYLIDEARKASSKFGYLLFVEGYLDAALAHQYGFESTTSNMGTAFTEEHCNILLNICNNHNLSMPVVFCMDADKGGRNATIRNAMLASQYGLDVRAANLPTKPDGSKNDPADFLRDPDFGPQELQKLIDDALTTDSSFVRFYYEHLRGLNPDHSSAANAQIISAMVPYLSGIGNEVQRISEIQYLSRMLQADFPTDDLGTNMTEAVISEIKKYIESPKNRAEYRIKVSQSVVLEQKVLSALLIDPDQRFAMEDKGLTRDCFSNPVRAAIYDYIKTGDPDTIRIQVQNFVLGDKELVKKIGEDTGIQDDRLALFIGEILAGRIGYEEGLSVRNGFPMQYASQLVGLVRNNQLSKSQEQAVMAHREGDAAALQTHLQEYVKALKQD